MVSVAVWFEALDLVSAVFALAVAAFFWRSARFTPGRGFGILAGAFAACALAYPMVSISRFHIFPDTHLDDAVRVFALLLSATLLFFHYIGAHLKLGARTITTGSLLATMFAVALVFAYGLFPAGRLPSPLTYLAAARYVETILLLFVAAVVTLEVRARSWSEFRVPGALICLAFSRYTTAALSQAGPDASVALVYAWRLLGLVLLLSVVFPARRPIDAKA